MMECALEARRRESLTWRVMCAGALASILVLVAGCSGTSGETWSGKQPSYKSSRSAPPLDIPPDLTSSSIQDSLAVPETEATYSQYSGAESGEGAARARSTPVLPEIDNARIERSGNERWLVIAGQPQVLWPRLRDFWIEQGFSIETSEPDIGIMETNWAQERTPLPAGFFKGLLNRLSDSIYGVTIRDRFRARIERASKPDTVEIYIAHRGAEEVVVGDESHYAQREGLGKKVWQPRPSDPGLEVEMLTRLMIFLGTDRQRADALVAASAAGEPRARIVSEDDGATTLVLAEDFEQAWRRTGIALDRMGFPVEDRDRSRGVFIVRCAGAQTGAQSEKIWWLSKLWGDDDGAEKDDDDTCLIRLSRLSEEEALATTRVVVLNRDGERQGSPAAHQILSLLHEQLR